MAKEYPLNVKTPRSVTYVTRNVPEVTVEQRERHDRIDDTEKRDQKRRQKIESKYLHVRLVVGQEAF